MQSHKPCLVRLRTSTHHVAAVWLAWRQASEPSDRHALNRRPCHLPFFTHVKYYHNTGTIQGTSMSYYISQKNLIKCTCMTSWTLLHDTVTGIKLEPTESSNGPLLFLSVVMQPFCSSSVITSHLPRCDALCSAVLPNASVQLMFGGLVLPNCKQHAS